MNESYIFNGFCPDTKALEKYGCTVIYTNETYKDISALKVQLRKSFSDAVVDAVVEKFIAKKTIPLVVFSAMMDTLLAAKPPKITQSKASKATTKTSKAKSTSKSNSKGTKSSKSEAKEEPKSATSKTTSKPKAKTTKSKSKASKTSKSDTIR